MAVTLAQAAALTQDTLQRGVIQAFIDYSPIMAQAPIMSISGSAYAYNLETTLPGVAWRGVNDSYTESTGVVAQSSEVLKILGGDADVDRFIEQTQSNINDQRAIQTRLKTKSLALEFNRTFFEGDTGSDVNEFDGLATRLTGAQVVTAGANGAPLTLDMLDDLLDRVVGGADVLYMNGWLIRKVNALQRAAGVAPEAIELYGRRVFMYAGVPIIDAGNDNTDAEILDFDETQGTESAAASIYAVKWGEQEFTSLLTNGGVMVDDLGFLETKPAYRTRVEFYVGLATFNGKCAARLQGLQQS